MPQGQFGGALVCCSLERRKKPAESRQGRWCVLVDHWFRYDGLVDAGALLGVEVLDHIIVGDGRYYSFKEAGRL